MVAKGELGAGDLLWAEDKDNNQALPTVAAVADYRGDPGHVDHDDSAEAGDIGSLD